MEQLHFFNGGITHIIGAMQAALGIFWVAMVWLRDKDALRRVAYLLLMNWMFLWLLYEAFGDFSRRPPHDPVGFASLYTLLLPLGAIILLVISAIRCQSRKRTAQP